MTEEQAMSELEIVETFSKYIKIVTQYKATRILGRDATIEEQDIASLKQRCQELIEQHQLYAGDNVDAYIAEFTKRLFDNRKL